MRPRQEPHTQSMHRALTSASYVPPPDWHRTKYVMQDKTRIAMLRRAAVQDAVLPLQKHLPVHMHFEHAKPR